MNHMSDHDVRTDQSVDRDWWRGAVIYQIYPRSFQDSSGDGIGDLQGIKQRLPYVASLGVNAIWLSPFYPSPMNDMGYDVSDYRNVDPIFGTLEDFDGIVDTAHRLGLKVIIDLVFNHTADVHCWFCESRNSRANPKSNWYVWADPKPDGTPPNNWLSVFGGSAWQWDVRREQYYLHNFLASQPDLNFHNLDVREAVLDVTRFWLQRGVDGFRLDAVNYYFSDQALRDNPALPPDQRNGMLAPLVNPYNHQQHLFSKSQPENLDFLTRFRSVLDDYSAAASIGEVGDALSGLEIIGQYTSGQKRLHMCYTLEFLTGDRPTAPHMAEVFERLAKAVGPGWLSWAFSNHDVMRHVTRWRLSPAAQRLYATLLMCLRGSVILYQGEELGLPEADLDFEDLQDPYGIEFWPEFKGRDGCRTPMSWDQSNPFGGMSQVKPWLPVPDEHLALCVDVQEQDATSLLHHYRRTIDFRRAHPALGKGALEDVQATGEVLSFVREHFGEKIFCAFNLSDGAGGLAIPPGTWTRIGIELGGPQSEVNGNLYLEPWQPFFALKAND